MTQSEKIQDITRIVKEIRSAIDLLNDLSCYVNTVAYLENAADYNFKDAFVVAARIREKARDARNAAANIYDAVEFNNKWDRVVSIAATID